MSNSGLSSAARLLRTFEWDNAYAHLTPFEQSQRLRRQFDPAFTETVQTIIGLQDTPDKIKMVLAMVDATIGEESFKGMDARQAMDQFLNDMVESNFEIDLKRAMAAIKPFCFDELRNLQVDWQGKLDVLARMITIYRETLNPILELKKGFGRADGLLAANSRKDSRAKDLRADYKANFDKITRKPNDDLNYIATKLDSLQSKVQRLGGTLYFDFMFEPALLRRAVDKFVSAEYSFGDSPASVKSDSLLFIADSWVLTLLSLLSKLRTLPVEERSINRSFAVNRGTELIRIGLFGLVAYVKHAEEDKIQRLWIDSTIEASLTSRIENPDDPYLFNRASICRQVRAYEVEVSKCSGKIPPTIDGVMELLVDEISARIPNFERDDAKIASLCQTLEGIGDKLVVASISAFYH
jgi:hypothetical protein